MSIFLKIVDMGDVEQERKGVDIHTITSCEAGESLEHGCFCGHDLHPAGHSEVELAECYE